MAPSNAMNRSGSKIPKDKVVLTLFPSPVMPDTSGVSLARIKKKKKKGFPITLWPGRPKKLLLLSDFSP